MKRISFLIFISLFALRLSSQVCDTTLWSPNGTVQSVYLRDSLLYVGGSFSQVSPVVGHFVAVDSLTAQVVHPFPMIRGTVNCMAKDSIGRIYVGGDFSYVGGLYITNLFRLDSLGNLDAAFLPQPNGEVTALYIYDNDLYVGGDFSAIAGFQRTRGAKLNVTDDTLDSATSTMVHFAGNDSLTDFDARSDGKIYSFCVEPIFGNVLVGGDFHNIAGTSLNYLAYVEALTGNYIYYPSTTPWSAIVNGVVRSIAIRSGLAYIGGDFTALGTNQRKGFAEVNISNAIATSFDAQLNGSVNDVIIVGNRIYLAGNFTVASGHIRNYVACFSTALNLLPWASNISSEVLCIRSWNDQLCIGGKFVTIGTNSCYHAAILDSVSGNPHAWNPMFDGAVRTIIPRNTGGLFCGGDFFGAGGVFRNNLCAININTRQPTAWAPYIGGTVNTITSNDTALFIAGTFTVVDAASRARIASYGLASGALNSFNPGVNGIVRTIAATDSLIYIGGNFTITGNQSRTNIACLDVSTSSVTNWNPGCQGTVNKIIIDHDHIYVGGFYSLLGGQPAGNAGRVDRVTGLTDLTWNCNTNDGVYDLDLYNGKLFLAGWFLNVNGSPRQYFAVADTTDGSLFSDDPGFNNYTRCFARYTTDLFISGAFENEGPSNNYAALCDLDNSSGGFDVWDPRPNAFPQSLAVNQDWLFMGGSFTEAGHYYHPNLAMVNVNTVTAVNESSAETENVRLFPDPTSGVCFIDLKNINGGISSCEIRDVSGRFITGSNGLFDTGIGSGRIDLSGFSDGIYFLTIRTNDGKMYCGKIVKQ